MPTITKAMWIAIRSPELAFGVAAEAGVPRPILVRAAVAVAAFSLDERHRAGRPVSAEADHAVEVIGAWARRGPSQPLGETERSALNALLARARAASHNRGHEVTTYALLSTCFVATARLRGLFANAACRLFANAACTIASEIPLDAHDVLRGHVKRLEFTGVVESEVNRCLVAVVREQIPWPFAPTSP